MKLRKYFAVCKVDETTHTITGVATAEVPDAEGEICDYEYARDVSYPNWSNAAAESTKAAGQDISYGNIRLQHSLQMAGKVSAAPIYDDDAQTVSLITEPIDDATWTKAKKGFIRGFSQGGDYDWRRCNDCATDIDEGNECPNCGKAVYIRYGARLSEVSYVDNPCVKVATFTLVKSDGSQIQTAFAPADEGEQMEKTNTPALDVDAITKTVTASVLAALNQKDAEKAQAALLLKAKTDARERDKATLAEAFGKACDSRGLNKSMYDIARLADVLTSISWVRDNAAYEAQYENGGTGDQRDADIGAKLTSSMEDLAETLKAVVDDETSELIGTATKAEKEQTMSKTAESALQKAARKTVSDHMAAAKAAVSDHCDKMTKAFEAHKAAMHGHIEKMAKLVGGDEASAEAGASVDAGGSEPTAINVQAEGTPNTAQKTAGGEQTFTKAQVDEMLQKAVDESVQAVLKALADDEEEDDGKEKDKEAASKAAPAAEVQKAAPAAGVGDRAQLPTVVANGGPVIRVHSVTKAADAQQASEAPVTGQLAADVVLKAMQGDPEAVRQFAKANRGGGIPATVAGALGSVKR